MNSRSVVNVVIVIGVVVLVVAVALYKSSQSKNLPSESEQPATSAPATGDRLSPKTPAASQPVMLPPHSTTAPAESPPSTQEAAPAPTTRADEKQLPRLLDIGSDKCAACKKLAPILEELKVECAGRARIEFIDAWKRPEARTKYGIQLIPTLIFYDTEGKETWRHIGFLSKEEILAKLREAGMREDAR
ncbi:MAG: thioredoxin domain-containing protein [Planctomycetota bacterium]